jgi:hypothetical protein
MTTVDQLHRDVLLVPNDKPGGLSRVGGNIKPSQGRLRRLSVLPGRRFADLLAAIAMHEVR